MKRRTVNQAFWAIGLLVVLAAAAFVGHRWYKGIRQRRLIRQARHFLDISDDKNALLCLENALLYNPNDAAAIHLMAEEAEAAHSPSALAWRERAVEFNPDSMDDRLSLAETALRMRDFRSAETALDGVSQTGRNTARYHAIAGGLAAAMRQPAIAKKHFEEVERLEPTNMAPRVNIAALDLYNTNSAAAAEARSFLGGLASNQTNALLRLTALRELTTEAIRSRRTNSELALSLELSRQTNAVFSDQLLRLDALAGTGAAEFKPALAALQRQAAPDPFATAELAGWEETRLPPTSVLSWLRTLPPAIQTNQSVALVTADCFASAGQWHELQVFIEPLRWKSMDFVRLAVLARALRGQGLTDTAKTQWDRALQMAGTSKQQLVTLLRLTTQWNWQNETEEIMWAIVQHHPDDKRAFQALANTLLAEGQTRSFLHLYTDAARRDPGNLMVKNNVAFTALLLGAQEFKPNDLAREDYKQAPGDSACASTYAFSLLLQKKNAEALKVMETLDARQLKAPPTAALYGLALAANGDHAKAKEFLAIGAKAQLLPEERKLLQQN